MCSEYSVVNPLNLNFAVTYTLPAQAAYRGSRQEKRQQRNASYSAFEGNFFTHT